MTFHCPQCDDVAVDTVDQRELDRYDATAERGRRAVQDALARLVRIELEDWAERFAAAVRDDHIVADDF